MCQTLGFPEPVVPMPPLASMRATESLSSQEMIQFTEGLDADHFLGEGDYAIFIQTHLMPPLMGARVDRVAGAPTADRTRATRVGTRGVPPIGQVTGWPESLTMLRCWRSIGTSYQIPIEPTETGHRYVKARNAPSVCTTSFPVFHSLSDIRSFRILIIPNAFAGTPGVH